MMTELEAVAECTAVALGLQPEGWAKAEANKATEHLKKLLKEGKVDGDVFANAMEKLAGNHSARRQRLVSWGLIPTTEGDSAEKRAIQAALTKISDEVEKSLIGPKS